MKDCVRYAPMLAAHEGDLTPDEAREVEAHLAGCPDCRVREAALHASEGLVSEALLAEASRRDFAPFVDGVMARIGARRSPLARLRGWAGLHRRLAAALGVVPVLAAAALVVYVRSYRPAGEELAMVELDAEGDVTMVLQTEDGPLVLLGADEPEGS
jgi:anti-sigma factor RsiW